MSTTIVLEAQTRTDMGKGASRRLRRLQDKVPAIVYGGDKKSQAVTLEHRKVIKALENESIYSSVLDLKVDGKDEKVIIKDLQRHPYKRVIMHMDLLRVSAKDILVKMIPLHFLNEDDAKGVKQGGAINHNMTQVEVRCAVKDLPEFIEVDLLDLELDETIHLSSIKLPKNVELAHEASGDHDHLVVSIHERKIVEEEPEEVAVAEGDEVSEEESKEGEEESSENKED